MGNLQLGIASHGCQHCCLLFIRILTYLPIEPEAGGFSHLWLSEEFNWADPLEANLSFPDADKTYGDVVGSTSVSRLEHSKQTNKLLRVKLSFPLASSEAGSSEHARADSMNSITPST